MKRNSVLIALSFLFVSTQLFAQEDPSPEKILLKVVNKLRSVKLLGYKYGFEFKVPSQDRLITEQADAFLELQPTEGTSKFRFQFSGAGRFLAYNGTEQFTLDKKGKKVYVESNPSFKSFGNIYLQNSPLSLKYALPKILADQTVKKTMSKVRSGDRERYVFEFSLRKRIINSEGEVIEIRPDHTNLLRLTVDKSSLLPVEVVQSNDSNDEVLKATFSDVTEKPALPDAPSWFYSSYLNEYTLQRKDKLTLIETGKAVPKFSLLGFEPAEMISSDEYKGKLVLLEFWIAHCGFCIAAVPKLNTISRTFSNMGLEVVSVNMYDPVGTIDTFKKKNKPEFTILTGGESIANTYGVESYPAIVLIGKDGKVVYSSSGLQEKELEDAIVANLKE